MTLSAGSLLHVADAFANALASCLRESDEKSTEDIDTPRSSSDPIIIQLAKPLSGKERCRVRGPFISPRGVPVTHAAADLSPRAPITRRFPRNSAGIIDGRVAAGRNRLARPSVSSVAYFRQARRPF
jgi:hypothetical protein